MEQEVASLSRAVHSPPPPSAQRHQDQDRVPTGDRVPGVAHPDSILWLVNDQGYELGEVRIINNDPKDTYHGKELGPHNCTVSIKSLTNEPIAKHSYAWFSDGDEIVAGRTLISECLDKILCVPKSCVWEDSNKPMMDLEAIKSNNYLRKAQRLSRHDPYRKGAELAQEEACDLMVRISKRKAGRCFNAGDHVYLKIPKIDRGQCSGNSIPCMVLNVNTTGGHKLRCEHGVIRQRMPVNQLRKANTDLAFNFSANDNFLSVPVVTVTSVATILSNASKSITTCNCRGGCEKKSCRCKKAGNLCTSKCHKGHICSNKDPIPA